MKTHTEAEAKKLWCPMVRVVSEDGAGYNRFSGNKNEYDPIDHACIASKCMMWQWEHGREAELGKRGFCGLVASPSYEVR
jgi:hypothetical protein